MPVGKYKHKPSQGFRKGYISWNKGKSPSLEVRQKISMASQGRKMSDEVRKNLSISRMGSGNPMYGKKLSLETRKKLSESHVGRVSPLRGRKLTAEHIKNRRIAQSGENHYNWKGGVTPINKRVRHSLEYKLWRESVFFRDDFTCVFCKVRGGKLNADHIKPFADYPELRFAIDNGRTLCVDCHKSTDTFGWKAYHANRQ